MNFELIKDALKYFFAHTLPKHRGLAKNSIDTYQQLWPQGPVANFISYCYPAGYTVQQMP